MQNLYNQQPNPIVPDQRPVPKKADFRQYVDPTGEVDSKKLAAGLWFLKNKVLLYRALLVVLGIVGGVFWIFSALKWIDYLAGLGSQLAVEKNLTKFQNFTVLQNIYSPQQLQIESAALYQSGTDKVDAVARVVNPNKNFVATIDYDFLIGGTKFPGGTATILPGETTFVPSLGLDKSAAVGSVLFEVTNMNWKRVPPHQIADPIGWQSARLQFDPSNFIYSVAGTDEVSANRLTFNLTNSSAYGYKQPKFYLAMYNGDSFVGMIPFQTEDFRSLEVKPIDLRNFTSNLQVQKIEVYPVINVYDDNVYLPPEQ